VSVVGGDRLGFAALRNDSTVIAWNQNEPPGDPYAASALPARRGAGLASLTLCVPRLVFSSLVYSYSIGKPTVPGERWIQISLGSDAQQVTHRVLLAALWLLAACSPSRSYVLSLALPFLSTLATRRIITTTASRSAC
jgi:hypothetical protein